MGSDLIKLVMKNQLDLRCPLLTACKEGALLCLAADISLFLSEYLPISSPKTLLRQINLQFFLNICRFQAFKQCFRQIFLNISQFICQKQAFSPSRGRYFLHSSQNICQFQFSSFISGRYFLIFLKLSAKSKLPAPPGADISCILLKYLPFPNFCPR